MTEDTLQIVDLSVDVSFGNAEVRFNAAIDNSHSWRITAPEVKIHFHRGRIPYLLEQVLPE